VCKYNHGVQGEGLEKMLEVTQIKGLRNK